MGLEKNLFETSAHIKMLQEWLSSNDSITLQILNRKKYSRKGGKILEKKKNDKYILYLANDIKIVELIDIIHRLEKELKLEKYRGFELLIEKTKINLGLALKKGEVSKEEIEDYISSYNISKDTLSRFQNQGIKINQDTKRWIKGLKPLNRENKEYNLEYDFVQHFYKIFFSKGRQMLHDNLRVFTKKDYQNFQKQVKEKKSNKKFSEEEIEGNVGFFANINDLYSKEKKLKEALNIKEQKKYIKKINNIKNKKEKRRILISIVNSIIWELYKYPRQFVEGAERPLHILNTKETHCVGKSILAHIFLLKLGIEHSVFVMDSHVALIVKIGGHNYYFDAVYYDKLLPIYTSDNNSFGKSEMIYLGKQRKRLGIRTSPELGLQSSMWTNIGNQLYLEGKLEEGFYCIDQAISIFPENSSAWNSMGVFMEKNIPLDVDTVLNCFERSLDINPENIESWIGRGKYIENKYEKIYSYAIKNLLEEKYKKAIKKFKILKMFQIVLSNKTNQKGLEKLIKLLKEKKYNEARKIAFSFRGIFI